MEITNELKAIEEVKRAIKYGLGLAQLKEKLDLSDEEILKIGAKHPDFLNDLNRRYKTDYTVKESEEPKKEPKIKEVAKKAPKKDETKVEKE